MRAHPAGPRHGEAAVAGEAPERPGTPAELNAIDPEIWPTTALRDAASGSLSIGGCDVRDLLTEFGSPLFVLDEVDFRRRAAAFRAAFGGESRDGHERPHVFYAAKAFLSTTIARWAVEEGLGIDVSTGGELACALRAGTPGSHLILHGNNKSLDEIRTAIAVGVGSIIIDSFEDIAKVEFAAAEAGVEQAVLIRVTVGVEAHTHEFIATAHEDQKFGFSIASGDAMEAVVRVSAASDLRLLGLHSHIGSQIFSADGFEMAATRVVGFMARIRDDLGVGLTHVDLGGGIGIKYVSHDQPPELSDLAEEIRAWVEADCERLELPAPELMVEPGRAIVGPAMITAYTVGTIKPVELDGGQIRTYVSVDGGMSDNIRTALYDAEYTVTLASRRSQAPAMLCRVVGRHCESGDVVVKDCWLPGDLSIGDVLAVAATGAYCRAMASNYNLSQRPPVVAVREARPTLMLRRETIDDVLALDVGPLESPNGPGGAPS